MGRKKRSAKSTPGVFLGPSKIHGVGVFAAGVIPKGTLLRLVDSDDWRYIEKPTGKTLKLCKHYCVWDGEGYHCPKSWTRMSVGWFLNDADDPNLEPTGFRFRALRRISAGEELTIDYDGL